jgi:hypothetical protein
MLLMRAFYLSLLIFFGALVSTSLLRAQSVDYVYGIEYGTGTGAGNQTWFLDQMSISVNASGTATSFTNTQLVDLRTFVTGWDTSGVVGTTATSRNFQCINGLAADYNTNTLFFNYTYTTGTTSSTGTFNSVIYSLRSTGSNGWSATQLTSLSAPARTSGSAGTPGDPGSVTTSAGWFTKGMLYQGAYYVGIQGATNNNLLKFTLNGNQTAFSGTQTYTLINHGGADASNGGDMVVDSNGNFYISGRNAAGTFSTFATTTLSNALSTTGTAWNSGTSADINANYYQLAGMGQLGRVYGIRSGTFGQLNNFTNPSAAAPTFTTLTGSLGTTVSFADLSDGLNHTLVVPEPSTVGAGIAGLGLAAYTALRGRRKSSDQEAGDGTGEDASIS